MISIEYIKDYMISIEEMEDYIQADYQIPYFEMSVTHVPSWYRCLAKGSLRIMLT